MTDLPTLSHSSGSEVATLSCTRSLKIDILFGSSLQRRSQDFSKGTHNFPNPPASPAPPPPPTHTHTTTFSRYVNPACPCAFPLPFSKYIGPPMNHASLRWKPTFRCKKEKSLLFQKKIFQRNKQS